MSLKEKAIHGTKWAMIDNLLTLGISFVISLILARLLTPADYGLVGMTTVFTAILNVFVTGGFGSSLIRARNISQKDFSTIFYFNLLVCILAYVLLFLSAPFIASFYNQPILNDIIKVLGLSLILNGLSVVQTAIRTKQINFKIQAQISAIANIISGIIGITLAYNGFGVWSIVWQILSKSTISTGLFWVTSKWKPAWYFSKKILKRHLNYSMHILKSQITISITNNIFYFVIGKYYSPSTLGLYSRAESFVNLFSKNIELTINKTSFSILCSVNDDKEKLIRVFNEFLLLTSFISAFLTLNFTAVSDNFIPATIGDKWITAAYYMKILSISAFFYPINTMNIRIANVVGRPDIFTKAISFQRILLIACAIIGVCTNIEVMLYGTVFVSICTYINNSLKIKQLVNISISEQIFSIIKTSLPSVIGAVIIWFIGYLLPFNEIVNLVIQLSIGAIGYLVYFEGLKNEHYLKIKDIIVNFILKKRSKNG